MTEMLIATAIMVSITGGIFTVLNPTHGAFHAQPEMADMQQRLRVAIDNLKKDLLMAGAGTYTGSSAGALYNYFAPIFPYRRGADETVAAGVCDDTADSAYYCRDTISIIYVPPTPAQTTVTGIPGNSQSEINVTAQNNCGPDRHDALCGFEEGMRVLVMDIDGSWDLVTITNVQNEAKKLQHHTDGDLSSDYDSGTAIITQVQTHTYYLKADETTETFELRHYDGDATDLAIVDNVVDLRFEYFGDPAPPTLLPNASLSSIVGPWTTYGPKPPTTGANAHGWPDGENCVFKVEGGAQVPRLDTLDTGVVQVKLDPSILDGSDEETRGAWCPSATSAGRYDADLLRIRRVRVTLRVQVAQAGLRGPAGLLFTRGGTSSSAERYIPDQEIKFDVTPRNMNLGR